MRSGVRFHRSPVDGSRKITSLSRIRPRAGSCRMRLHTWKPPESDRTGRSQSMNRWTPPAAWITRAPGRRRRWNAFTTSPSTPTPRRSSLVTPRTPARVASGRKVGTGSVPRRVTSGSGTRRLEGQHEDELVRDGDLRHIPHATGVDDEALEPGAIGPGHASGATGAATQGARREAHDRVAYAQRPQQPGRGVRVLPIEGGDELQQQRDVSNVGWR